MQCLCLKSVVLFITITYCVTQRTQLNAVESLFALSSGNSYPFCVWPANFTASKCDSRVSLLCVIHGCHHGPSIVVGDHEFMSEDNLNLTCVQSPNSTGLDGTWVARLTLEISDVALRWNSSEPIPMYCKTGSNQSEIAHLSIPTHCYSVPIITTSSAIYPTPTTRSISMTISPNPTSSVSLISSTNAPQSSPVSYSSTQSNSVYGLKKFSSIFAIILSFVPSLLNAF